MLKALLLGAVVAASVPVFAGEMILLPIKQMEHQRTAAGEQLVVTIDFQACKYTYKGLYLEQIGSGHGQLRYEVRALAAPRTDGNCQVMTGLDGQLGADLRTDSLTLNGVSADRYDFIAIQPK
jgi:hypothetical protein